MNKEKYKITKVNYTGDLKHTPIYFPEINDCTNRLSEYHSPMCYDSLETLYEIHFEFRGATIEEVTFSNYMEIKNKYRAGNGYFYPSTILKRK